MAFTKSSLTIAVLAASLSGCGGAEFDGRIFGESLENGSGILVTPVNSDEKNRIITSGFIIEAGSTTDIATLDVNMEVAPKLTSVGIATNIGESGVVVVQFDSPVELDEDAISLAIKDNNAVEFVPVNFPVNLVQSFDGTSSVRSFVGSLAGIANSTSQSVQVTVDADRVKSTSGVLLDESNSVPLVSELELRSSQPTVSISDTPVLIQPFDPSASSQNSLSTSELISESITGSEISTELNAQNSDTDVTKPVLDQLVNQDSNDEIIESSDISEPRVELVNQSPDQVVPLDQEIQIKLSNTDGPELDDSSRAEEICSSVNLTNVDTQQEIAAIPVSANTDEVVCGFALQSQGDDVNFGPGQTFEVEVPENTVIDYSNKGNDELKTTLVMASEQVVTVDEGFVALSMSGSFEPLVDVQFNFDGEMYSQQLNEGELQAICGSIDASECLKTLTASIIESYQTAKAEEVQNNTRVTSSTILSRVVDGDIRMNADGSLLYNSIKESFISSSQSDPLDSNENEGDDGGDVQNTADNSPEPIIVEENTEAASEQSSDVTNGGIGTETSSPAVPVVETKNSDSRRLQRLTNQIDKLWEKREKNDELLAGLKAQVEASSNPQKSLIKQERKVERRVASLESKIVKKQEKIEKIQQRQSDSVVASSDKTLVGKTANAKLSKAEKLKRKQERRAQRQQARKEAEERRKAKKLANKLEKQEQNRIKREAQQKAKAEKKQQRQARLERQRAKQRADKAEKAALRKQQRQARLDKQAAQRNAKMEAKEAKRKARLAERAAKKAQRDARKAASKVVTPA